MLDEIRCIASALSQRSMFSISSRYPRIIIRRSARRFIHVMNQPMMSRSKSLMTAKGGANVPMKFFFPNALIPFFTPTPESHWLNVVVGMRMCRTPRCAVAAASPEVMPLTT